MPACKGFSSPSLPTGVAVFFGQYRILLEFFYLFFGALSLYYISSLVFLRSGLVCPTESLGRT